MGELKPINIPFIKSASKVPCFLVNRPSESQTFAEAFVGNYIDNGFSDNQIAEAMAKVASIVGHSNFNKLLNKKKLSADENELIKEAYGWLLPLGRAAWAGGRAGLSRTGDLARAAWKPVSNQASKAINYFKKAPTPSAGQWPANMAPSAASSGSTSLLGRIGQGVGQRWNSLSPTTRSLIKYPASIAAGMESYGLLQGEPYFMSKFVPSLSHSYRQNRANQLFETKLNAPETVELGPGYLSKLVNEHEGLPTENKSLIADYINQSKQSPQELVRTLPGLMDATDSDILKQRIANQQRAFDKQLAAVDDKRKYYEQQLSDQGVDPAQMHDEIDKTVSNDLNIPITSLPKRQPLPSPAKQPQTDPAAILKEVNVDPSKLQTVKPEQVAYMQSQLGGGMQRLQADLSSGRIDRTSAIKSALLYYKQSLALAAITASQTAGQVLPIEQLEQMAKSNDPVILSMAKNNFEKDPGFAQYVSRFLPEAKGDVRAAADVAFSQYWDNLGNGPLGVGGQLAVAGGVLSSILGLVSMAMGHEGGLGLIGMGVLSALGGMAASPMGLSPALSAGKDLFDKGMGGLSGLMGGEQPRPFTTGPVVANQPRSAAQFGKSVPGQPSSAAAQIDLASVEEKASNIPAGPARADFLIKAVPFNLVKQMTNGYVDQTSYSKMIDRASRDPQYLNTLVSFAQRAPSMGILDKISEGRKLLPS
mgnify:CR=1 FL=1